MIPEKAFVPYECSALPEGPYLVFAPHPDDESIGMGGTIAKAVSSGIEVNVVFMTSGEFAGEASVREKEAVEACKILGIKNYFFLAIPDRSVYKYKEIVVNKVKEIVEKVNPKTIFLPSFLEFHPDHRATTVIVLEVLKDAGIPREVWLYEIGRQGEVNRLIDISSQVEIKSKAIRAYESQLKFNNYEEIALAVNKARTFTLRGIAYAEGFLSLGDSFYFEKLSEHNLKYFQDIDHIDALPLVSVIVRTKNRPNLLVEALNSLANQTYPLLEAVVVNDGGKDVFSIIEGFVGKIYKVKYIHHEISKGRAESANSGIKNATGEWIGFLDDDDILLPDHVETLIKRVLISNSKVVFSRTALRIVEDGKADKVLYPWEGGFSKELLLLGNYIPLNSLLFHREVFETVGFFDNTLELFEDWDFLIRVSSRYDFSCVDKVTAEYRLIKNIDQIASESHGLEREENAYFNVIKKHFSKITSQVLYRNFLHRAGLRWELAIARSEYAELENKLLLVQHKLEEYVNKNKELENQLKELENQLKELENQLKEKEKLLNEILSSFSWVLICKARAFMEFLAPKGTYRRALFNLFKRALLLFLSGRSGLNKLYNHLRTFFKYAKIYGIKGALGWTNSAVVRRELIEASELEEERGKIFLSLLTSSNKAFNFNGNNKVTVIIPVFNAFEKTVRCLESVLKNSPKGIELIVIDDASTDERVYPFLLELSKNHGFKLLRNSTNLGFVKTVNIGLKMRKGHAVILNSDTEVPPRWLERLVSPIVMLPDTVASVTPFSNKATICSFPNFCKDNELFDGMSVEEIDSVFEKFFGKVKPIEIPTAVGFCMALNDKTLEEIGYFNEEVFGKGYGEENDWSMRARKKGYKNVVVPWLFVAHHHGASFGKEKDKLTLEALKKVENLHPDYTILVNDFISKDPLKSIRDVARFLLLHKDKPNILIINQKLLGGSQSFLSILVDLLKGKANFLNLEISGSEVFIKSSKTPDIVLKMDLSLVEFLDELVKLVDIHAILVNHAIGVKKIERLLENISKAGVPYHVIVHDFYTLCPIPNLIDSEFKFCNVPDNPELCNYCLSQPKSGRINILEDVPKDIKMWRSLWHPFLSKATSIICPSEEVSKIILRAYPDLKIEVIPHYTPPLEGTLEHGNVFQWDGLLRVVSFGAIDPPKGSNILYELYDLIRAKNLPIRIILIGYTSKHQHFNSKELIITGPYKREELPLLVNRYKPHLAFIPSICPETFCYTLSEAFMLGLPAVVFDIGAQAAKVRQSGAGVVVKEISAEAVLEVLLDFWKDPEKIKGLSFLAKQYLDIDRDEWIKKWERRLGLP